MMILVLNYNHAKKMLAYCEPKVTAEAQKSSTSIWYDWSGKHCSDVTPAPERDWKLTSLGWKSSCGILWQVLRPTQTKWPHVSVNLEFTLKRFDFVSWVSHRGRDGCKCGQFISSQVKTELQIKEIKISENTTWHQTAEPHQIHS